MNSLRCSEQLSTGNQDDNLNIDLNEQEEKEMKRSKEEGPKIEVEDVENKSDCSRLRFLKALGDWEREEQKEKDLKV